MAACISYLFDFFLNYMKFQNTLKPNTIYHAGLGEICSGNVSAQNTHTHTHTPTSAMKEHGKCCYKWTVFGSNLWIVELFVTIKHSLLFQQHSDCLPPLDTLLQTGAQSRHTVTFTTTHTHTHTHCSSDNKAAWSNWNKRTRRRK